MRSDELSELLNDACDKAFVILNELVDPTEAGDRAGQYRLDLAVDGPLVEMFVGAGFGVLSEESGEMAVDSDLIAVIDPVDGSTNASLGLPWYATSICIVDGSGALQSIVANHASGDRFEAVRGRGSTNRGEPIRPSAVEAATGVVGINGLPRVAESPGVQFRCFGAAALDLCAVASGSLNGYVDLDVDGHGVWDYLGALLICSEAGVQVVDAFDRDLLVLDHSARRTPVAASTSAGIEHLVSYRRQDGHY